MPKNLPLLLCQIYPALLLLAAAAVFPAEGVYYPVLCAALALAAIVFMITRRPPRHHIVLDTALIFLVPVLLAIPLEKLNNFTSVTGGAIALALSLPAFYLLDYHLRENARHNEITVAAAPTRRPTHIFYSLLAAVPVMLLVALVSGRMILMMADAAFLLYLLATLAGVLVKIPHPAFTTAAIAKRLVAGTAGDVPFELNSRSSLPLRVLLSPAVPWAEIKPGQAVLNQGVNRFVLSLKPPLAGQAHPQLKVKALDPRGLFYVSELLEPVNLHVIPRGEYAAWLAQRYLDQTHTGSAAAAETKNKANAMRSAEYRESRDYRPGDPLRDIDWKHTLKLSQLIVREYKGAGGQGAIIAVNLAVTDEEAADMLAFYLITTALTLAREEIPTALTAYNQREVVSSTRVLQPAAAVTQALALTGEISIAAGSERRLEPADVAKIRRTMRQLRQVKTAPARRLLELLDYEHRTTEEAAKQHPATRALAAVTRDTPAPAMIFVVSQFNHDAEAILVNTEKLAGKNYSVVPVASA
ncbi:MAG: DUF58 domain-containing protein [Dehalococcoidales bacterium]|jgi:uncharacterized protein (DUF58 family)